MPSSPRRSHGPSPDMPIVGTAGHVDHGKSTLVEALTGTDPDRWAEEKERGLTIDLGFAWTELDGFDVGFVDVPGHERFIKNMLAGVGAVDCALFVVAADSGWMPQSEEHAAVLDLIGTSRGVIALTRVDLVDADTLELATLEVLGEIEGTSLEGWPILPVSAIEGTGIPELRKAIVDVLAATQRSDGPFRMWVDRAFSISGAGQVATGSVISGTARRDDELVLLPDGARVRVRGVQHHGGTVDEVRAGDRAAVNLVGAPSEIGRGQLLAEEDTSVVTKRLVAMIRPARSIGEIPARGAFHLHVGTASRPVTARRLGDGDAYLVTMDEPIPVTVGDPVILRDSGRRAVVGGGSVVDPIPVTRPSLENAIAAHAMVKASPAEQADVLLRLHGTMRLTELVRATSGGRPTEGITIGDTAISVEFASDVEARAADAVEAFHAEHPTRPGCPKAELASRLEVDASVIDAVVERSPSLREEFGAVRLVGFSNQLDPSQEAQWTAVRVDLERSFDVPRLRDLPLDQEVVHFLLRRGDLVRVDGDLAYTRTQADEIVDRVAELEDGFTVSELRTHFGMTRRQAVPTAEWLDSIGRTRRQGDGRIVRDRV